MPTPEPIETLSTDVLIVGSGALRYAPLSRRMIRAPRCWLSLRASSGGRERRFTASPKSARLTCQTMPAMGDSPDVFLHDILVAAQGMSIRASVPSLRTKRPTRCAISKTMAFRSSATVPAIWCFAPAFPHAHVPTSSRTISAHRQRARPRGKSARHQGPRSTNGGRSHRAWRRMPRRLRPRSRGQAGHHPLEGGHSDHGRRQPALRKEPLSNDITGDGMPCAARRRLACQHRFMQAGVNTQHLRQSLRHYLWDALPNRPIATACAS